VAQLRHARDNGGITDTKHLIAQIAGAERAGLLGSHHAHWQLEDHAKTPESAATLLRAPCIGRSGSRRSGRYAAPANVTAQDCRLGLSLRRQVRKARYDLMPMN
jgi:hypothetical protein